MPGGHAAKSMLCLFQQFHRCQCRSAANGVGTVGVSVIQGLVWGVAVKSFVHFFRTHCCSQGGKTPGEAFGQADQVGSGAGFAAGKPLPGASKADHHLVINYQDAVVLQQFFQAQQEGAAAQAHSCCALDQRFQDHGRIVARFFF